MLESSGIEQRDLGMARVERSARPSQKFAAKMAIKKCAIKHGPWLTWTTDDVHTELKKMEVELDNARLLGPLMKRAQKAGLIEPVVCSACNRQETRLSKRKERHAGPQYIWRTTTHYYYEFWRD
ncbi:MAG: hypothetical protein CMB22_02500 [Euryarchaeota archaeon]|nr:hypothetical protein [Euryarchaeota archaeon]|tara:strand:+ start:5726 stop:6097 length:372 start_codon:yes stop_codon:yes gene_type:complete